MLIYKYCPLGKGEFTFDNMKSNQLMFKTLDKYNDLFEGDNLLLPLEEYYKDPTLAQRELERCEKYKKDFVVCCFCRTGDNQTMWANYAKEDGNDNKGVCLIYESDLLPAYFEEIQGVIYRDSPRYLIENGKVKVVEMARTKTNDWRSENEIRYIIPRSILDDPKGSTLPDERPKIDYLLNNMPTIVPNVGYLSVYPRTALKKLYFGANADLDNHTEMIDWCKLNGIEVSKMEPNRLTNQLEPEAI